LRYHDVTPAHAQAEACGYRVKTLGLSLRGAIFATRQSVTADVCKCEIASPLARNDQEEPAAKTAKAFNQQLSYREL
jgi:hypothetical protein